MASGTISLNPKPKLFRVNIIPKPKPATVTQAQENGSVPEKAGANQNQISSIVERITARARNNIENSVQLSNASDPQRTVRVKRLLAPRLVPNPAAKVPMASVPATPSGSTAAPVQNATASSPAIRALGRKTVADVLRSKPTPSTTAGIVAKSASFQVPPVAAAEETQSADLGDYSRFSIMSRNKRLQYCRVCSKGFKTQELFVQHFVSEHPGVNKPEDMFEDPWRCMYCDKWFDGPRRLSFHVKAHHKDALSVKESVIDNKPQLVECKLCGAVLKSSLIKHTLKAHASEIDALGSDVVKDPRRCALCNKMCSGEQGLRHHLYRTHGSDVAKQLDKTIISLSEHAGAKRPNVSSTVAGRMDEVVAKRVKLISSNYARKTDDHYGLAFKDTSVSKAAKPSRKYTPEDFDFDTGTRSDSASPPFPNDNLQIVEEEVVTEIFDEEIMPHEVEIEAEKGDFDGQNSPMQISATKIDDESAEPAEETNGVTFCEDCKLDLSIPSLYSRHYTLRHTPMQCTLCSVWLKGQIGLETHDDSVHRGALRLGAVTSFNSF